MRNSDRLAEDAALLNQFLRDFLAYVDYEPDETARSDARVGQVLRSEVLGRAGTSAGAAADAFARHGRAGSRVMDDWPRASGWDDAWAIRQSVIADVTHAMGSAERAKNIAKTEERTFTGRLASVLGWPRELAERVGGTRSQQRAARTIGYVGQVAIVVIGGYLLWLLTNL